MRKGDLAGVELFSGWKDIATYLGKGVRTAQRYEWELSLPVRRPNGKSRGSVIATKAELDGWVAAAPFRGVFQLPQKSVGPAAIDTRAALNELQQSVRELRQLRQETALLRAALHETVESLRENLCFTFAKGCSSVRPGANVLDSPSKKVQ